jgi:hypothetical protein
VSQPSDFEQQLRGALPLLVTVVTLRDRWIALRGESWDMDFDAPWRVTDDQAVLFGWSSLDASESAQSLRGLYVVDFASDHQQLRVVIFDNGWRLEVFRDVGTSQTQSFSRPHRVPFSGRYGGADTNGA